MSISLNSQRVFHQTIDISTVVSDFRVATYALSYTSGQYLYIGSSLPFNNLWFDLSTVASATAGTPTISIRWGNSWSAAVDVIDGTVGMTKSGRLSWATDILKGWDIEQYSTDIGLTGTNVYNKYWVRISWGSNFTAGISYIGQKFSSDTAFRSHYPDLLNPQILNGFKQGKTNWDEQHFMAAEFILKDLKKRDFIKDRGQVVDWSMLEDAACHKVAEMVYKSFGKPFEENTKNALKAYESELSAKYFNIDYNANGHVESCESVIPQGGWMTR